MVELGLLENSTTDCLKQKVSIHDINIEKILLTKQSSTAFLQGERLGLIYKLGCSFFSVAPIKFASLSS